MGREYDTEEQKTGPMHLTSIEIGKLITQLKAGDFKSYLIVLSAYVVTTTPWFSSLRRILVSNATLAIVPSMLTYINTMATLAEETEDEALKVYRRRAAYRMAKFGTTYYNASTFSFELPPADLTAEQVTAAIDEFNTAVEAVKSNLESKFAVGMPNDLLDNWLITTRLNLIKIEDEILNTR